jgi:hypothetical protein
MRDDGENNGVQEGDRNKGSGLDVRMHTMRPFLRRHEVKVPHRLTAAA